MVGTLGSVRGRNHVGSRRRSLAAGVKLTLLTCVVSAALAVAAVDARAETYINYGCGVIASGTWCSLNVRHTYNYNFGGYEGSGTVWVCQKTIDYSSRNTVEISCAYNGTDQSFFYAGLQIPLVYNGGPNSHTIGGSAGY
jgi:hypothetical protein